MGRARQQQFDVIVIGSGPAGEGAAMGCAKNGRRVALVERAEEVGGGCTHWGTIPSKALRHSVQSALEFRRNPIFSGINDHKRFEFPTMLKNADSVIRKQVSMRRDFYLRNEVAVIHGFGRFLEDHLLEVEVDEGNHLELKADYFVIATGSSPFRPNSIDFSHPRVHDSDTILNLDHTPGTITIFGAGVIGCEYASIFRNLGVKVNLINGRDKLLSFLDDEIIDALAYHLRDQGVILRNNEAFESVDASEHHAILHLKSGKQIKSDIVLWAQGRSGNTAGLQLETVGVVPNKRGHIAVDKHYRVLGKDHIYAVGDVVGQPGLASAGYDQGRFAACHIDESNCDLRLVEDIPTGIYTSPEISSVGRTERELTAEGIPYEVGHALFRSLARAQITGNNVGMLKLLFHRESLQLLGIHCFGDQAAEIVHIGQAIMAQEGNANSIEFFVRTTFNYPTMAEAYRVAALNGLNRLC